MAKKPKDQKNDQRKAGEPNVVPLRRPEGSGHGPAGVGPSEPRIVDGVLLVGDQRVPLLDIAQAMDRLRDEWAGAAHGSRTPGGGLVRPRGRPRKVGPGADSLQEPIEGDPQDGRRSDAVVEPEPTATALHHRDESSRDAHPAAQLTLVQPGGESRPLEPGAKGVELLRLHALDARVACISSQGSEASSAFAEAVRSVRRSYGFSQALLSDGLGITRGRVSQLESGDAWSLDLAGRAAQILGVPLAELLGGVVLAPEERAVIDALRRGNWIEAMRAITEIAATK